MYEYDKFHTQLSWAWKKFYNLGARIPSIPYLAYIEHHLHHVFDSVESQKFKL